MKRHIYSAMALILVSSLAHAHSQLTGSEPADKASLAEAPKEVMLHFSEPVRLTAVSITPSGGAKQNLAGIPKEQTTHVTLAAPDLGDGQYEVEWRAVSADAHIMAGVFTFSVAAAGTASPAGHAQHSAPDRPAQDDHHGASHQR
jgi:methionine-rich copper-binding protein CopC